MDMDGMPPRRPCKRQPPSPALESPAFAESKRTDLRPSPGQMIPLGHQVGHQRASFGSTNPGAQNLSSQFRQQHSTHNVKGRCPIEMNLACRGAASTSRTNTQRRSLNSFQRSFLSINSGVKSGSPKPRETKVVSTRGLQTSPVTVSPYTQTSGVNSMSPNVAALGEAVNRMSTSVTPISSKPTPTAMPATMSLQQPYNQYDSTYLMPQHRGIDIPPQTVPSVSTANSISNSMPPPVPNYHYSTAVAPGNATNIINQPINQPVVKMERKVPKKKSSKPRKPWSERKAPGKWTKAEDEVLRKAVTMYGAKEWKKIAAVLGGSRTSVQCLHRWNKVLKPGLVKGPWSKEEDRVVFDMVTRYGVGNVKWSFIAQQLKGRIGKQCRERWFNHLDPTIIKTPWTIEEDRIMFESQQKLGNRWCEIAKLLPGRTENMVKNRWNSSARKRWFALNGLTPGPARPGKSSAGRKKKAANSTKTTVNRAAKSTPKRKNRPNVTINAASLQSPGWSSFLNPSPGYDDGSFPLPSPGSFPLPSPGMTQQILQQSDMVPFMFSPAGTPTPKAYGDPAFQWDYVVSTAGNQNGLLNSPCLPSPSSMLISPTALNRLTTVSPSASEGVAGDMLNQDYMAQFTAEFA